MGVAGAALATAISEIFSGGAYVALLMRKRLLRLGALLTPPRPADLLPLLRGGAAMLLRQAALNVAFITATRRCQLMDATGVSAAAYSITNQVRESPYRELHYSPAQSTLSTHKHPAQPLPRPRCTILCQVYSLGVVVMLAMQATGATLVPAALARGQAEQLQKAGDGSAEGEASTEGEGSSVEGFGVAAARRVADRLIGWSTAISVCLAAAQAVAMPFLTPLFTPLPEVRAAIVAPARVAALVQLTNGPLFAGEGILMGVGGFGYLAGLTSVGVAAMVIGLSISARLNLGVASIWWSLFAFHIIQLSGTLWHHLRLSPLAAATGAASAEAVECAVVQMAGEALEVCVAASEVDSQAV